MPFPSACLDTWERHVAFQSQPAIADYHYVTCSRLSTLQGITLKGWCLFYGSHHMRIGSRTKDTSTFFLPGFGPEEETALTETAEKKLTPVISKVETKVFTPVIIDAKCALEAIEDVASFTADVETQTAKTWPQFTDLVGYPPSGELERLQRNVEILKLSKQIKEEGRSPTDKESESILSFTGWGSIARIFAGGHEGKALGTVYTDLKALLTEEEWASARAATPNAHYTDPGIARALWAIIKRLGFTGGNIIEPAAGTGVILACMPQDIAKNSNINAVEIDTVSGGLLKQVFEPHGVQVALSGIEKAKKPHGFFDLAIGNVPFGNYQVPDTTKSAYASWSVHNYFFGKAIDMVRPGGLVVFITSSYTLDGNLPVREWLGSQAEMLEAIRLPKGAFQRQARTEVVTDIIVLRKRVMPKYNAKCLWTTEGVQAPIMMMAEGQVLTSHTSAGTLELARKINPWFAKNAHRVLGKLRLESSQYSGAERLNVNPIFEGSDAELHSHLQAIIASMEEGRYAARSTAVQATEGLQDTLTKVRPVSDVKPGSFVMHGERIHVSEGDAWIDVDDLYKGKTRSRLIGMMRLRDAARKLIEYQRDNRGDEGLGALQAKLNSSYDQFVKEHGYLFEKMNVRAFRADPDCPLVLSLEIYDEETQTGRKADMFSVRTINQKTLNDTAETVKDAMLLSLAEHGRIVVKDMARRMRVSAKAVKEQMAAESIAFKDPETGEWVESDAYLSGHIQEKLNVATAAGPNYTRNVLALTAVMPTPLGPGEICLRLGAPWIPTEVVRDFIVATAEVKNSQDIEVTYSADGAVWSVAQRAGVFYAGNSALVNTRWGTSSRNFYALVEAALNQQPPTITATISGTQVVDRQATMAAREKYEAIKDHFKVWAWGDENRSQKLVRIYNEQFNQIVARKWNGTHLVLPGLSDVYHPYPSQLNAVWRILTSGNTLLAHVVGAGKSLTMMAASMELRRLGKSQKPVHVIPNHMLYQYTGEFLRAYPNANVLMATKESLAGDKRREFAARIATGSWDAIVMTHSSFERLSCRPETVKGFVDEMLGKTRLALSNASGNGSKRSIKELEKRLKNLEAKLEKSISDSRKDEMIHFEDLGVDQIFIDEGHLFKNLMRISKMPRIAGLPNTASQRAMDLLIKTRALGAMLGDKEEGVVISTATPIANSIAEMHVMQQYLQPKTLEKLGLLEFDAWAATFGETVTGMEIAPDGSGYRMNSRFSRFVNVAELMSIFKMVADIQTKQMLKLPTPAIVGGRPKVITAPASPELKSFTKSLVERAEKVRNRKVKPNDDNMLKITNEGRLAALDMRLINPLAEVGDDTKLCKVRDEVMRIYRETHDRKGTQLVFCDLSTPTAVGFSAYNQLRTLLIEAGMPQNEIAFIHDYDTDAAKDRLFQMVREGRVRVLMGSTQKMGFGTNVQRLLKAVHQVDGPWRPADLEQRDGRILRVGNTWEEVELLRYVTEGSFDSYIWQLLETKSKFIEQIMSGDSSLRTVEDVSVSALSCAEIKAIASGNPLVLHKAQVDAEIGRLVVMRDIWAQEQWSVRNTVKNNRQRVQYLKDHRQHFENDAAMAQRALEAGVVFEAAKGSIAEFSSKGTSLTERIGLACQRASYLGATLGDLRIGSIAGFELNLRRGFSKGIELVTKHANESIWIRDVRVSYVTETGEDVLAIIRQIADQMEKRLVSIAKLESESEALEMEISDEFPNQTRLLELFAKQSQIDAELDLDKDEAGAALIEECANSHSVEEEVA